MHFSLAKCIFWKGGKSERDFGKMKWHVNMHEKNAGQLEKKRSDISFPFGVPLCDLELQKTGFGREPKSKGTLKN